MYVMANEEDEKIDEELLNAFLGSLALEDLRERFKIKPEDFKTRLDLQCYLIALQITATDKEAILPISGKPKTGKSTLGMWIGIKTKEALRKEFHVEISEFDVEKDIHYPPISEDELQEMIDKKPPMMMFDRAIFNDETLVGMGFGTSEIKDLKEGVVVYFSNMKTRKKGYNKFENDVKDIFQKAFIYDLIFTNPLMPEKNYAEFCDIFIKFFDSALIVQCKESAIEDPEKLTKRTVIAGLNQLKTSMNRAKARSKKLFMVNSNKIFKDYDFTDIKDIYPILVVNKKLPFLDYNMMKDDPKVKKLDFVPIILTIEDLKFLISELDTPSDLFAYFKKREEFIKADQIIFMDERELLSYYLMNQESFQPKNVGSRYGVLVGFHEEYKNGRLSDIFAKGKELDKISHWVDDIIKLASKLSEDHENYLKALEEVLKLNRIQRRKLAERAEEKRKKAIDRKGDAWGITLYQDKPDIGFVLYFTPKLDKKTYDFFEGMCITAQYKAKTKKIVGLLETTETIVTKEAGVVPHFRAQFYIERIDPLTPEEEKDLKKGSDMLWGEEQSASFFKFKS